MFSKSNDCDDDNVDDYIFEHDNDDDDDDV